jgi:hypothetical protein
MIFPMSDHRHDENELAPPGGDADAGLPNAELLGAWPALGVPPKTDPAELGVPKPPPEIAAAGVDPNVEPPGKNKKIYLLHNAGALNVFFLIRKN